MAYTTVAEVKDILAKDAENVARTAASLSDSKIQEQIKGAEEEVNSRLGVRYTVPFTDPVPAVVEYITRDFAAYYSDMVYRQSKDFSSELDPVYLRYQRAMELLKDLASGDATIVPPDGGSGIDRAQARGLSRSPGRFFTLNDFGLTTRPGRSGRRVVTRHESPPYYGP